MKKRIFFILCLLSLLSLSVANGQALDRVVAHVNNDIITQTELSQAINALTLQLKYSGKPLPSNKELQTKALDYLIGKKLQLQLIKKLNIKVTDKQLDQAIQKIAERNHMTMAQLKEQLVKENLPYIKFRRQIQEQMLLSQLQQQMAGSQVSISEQEVTDFMHKNPPAAQGPVFYHLQDIVVEIPDEPTATQVQAAQTKAETLIGKLKTGKDFAAALKSFSVDEKTDDIQMNDLGWRNAQEVPSLFEKTVKNMKTGDIVGPIRAPNGFHVLKLEDKKVQGGEAKLTREDAKRLIYQQKLDNKLQEWVKKTRESAYIKIMTDKNKDKIKNKAKEESRPSTD